MLRWVLFLLMTLSSLPAGASQYLGGIELKDLMFALNMDVKAAERRAELATRFPKKKQALVEKYLEHLELDFFLFARKQFRKYNIIDQASLRMLVKDDTRAAASCMERCRGAVRRLAGGVSLWAATVVGFTGFPDWTGLEQYSTPPWERLEPEMQDKLELHILPDLPSYQGLRSIQVFILFMQSKQKAQLFWIRADPAEKLHFDLSTPIENFRKSLLRVVKSGKRELKVRLKREA